MTNILPPINSYINTFIHDYVKTFRRYIANEYQVNIIGLADFINEDDKDVNLLISFLRTYGFDIIISNGQDTIEEIMVEYICKDREKEKFKYTIENLISTIFLSSKTDISIVGMLVMQIISRIICKYKIVYKAIILDLDDTLWKGTLAEDGIEAIKQNLCENEAIPFVTFMRFIQTMSKELGLYVAICSRNNIEVVRSAIDKLNESEFPLIGQIDCIVANYNDKSKNIEAIAQKLSILPGACIFVDDNKLIRDEVRRNLPDVFVPDWKNHDELLTLFMTCGVFDRFELSLRARARKRLFEILQREREKCYLPKLLVKVSDDANHAEAVRLYAKSNQFKFTEKNVNYDGCKSLVFEIYRDSGENIGIGSALTYKENDREIHVINWAISCRYFEIGLEEYILMHIKDLSNGRFMKFAFDDTMYNGRTIDLINKYKNSFVKSESEEYIFFSPSIQSINDMRLNTNLEEYSYE